MSINKTAEIWMGLTWNEITQKATFKDKILSISPLNEKEEWGIDHFIETLEFELDDYELKTSFDAEEDEAKVFGICLAYSDWGVTGLDLFKIQKEYQSHIAKFVQDFGELPKLYLVNGYGYF